MQHLQPGLDPTGLECVTKADLLQMWTAAKAFGKEGWLIWSQTSPNVVASAEYAFYLWFKLDGNDIPTGEVYYYKTGAWITFPFVDGSKLGDNSVPISKLKLQGSNALDIIQVNAANNGWQFVSLVNAIQNNSIPVTRLVAPDGVN